MNLAEKLKADLEGNLNSEFEGLPLNEDVVSKNPVAPSLEAPEVTPETPEEVMMVARTVRKQAQEEEGMAFGNPSDLAHQFNNTVVNIAGAPVEMMEWALNRVAGTLFPNKYSYSRDHLIDGEWKPAFHNTVGSTASIRKVTDALGQTSDENPDTYMGYTGATLGEAAGFLAGGAGLVQKTKTAGGFVGAISRSADDALRTKLGTVVAGETVAAGGAGMGRAYSEDNEYGATGSLLVEFTAGALALLSAAGAKKVALDPLTAKLKNMTQKEALEKLSKEEIAEVVAEGQRVIDKDKPKPETPEAPATPKDAPEGEAYNQSNVVGVKTETVQKLIEVDRASEGVGLSNTESLKTLGDSLKNEGFKEPLTITYDPASGKALLTDGNTRLAAAIEEGIEEIPIVVNRQYNLFTDNYKVDGSRPPVKIAEPNTELGQGGLKYSTQGLKNILEAPATPKDTPEPTPAPELPETRVTGEDGKPLIVYRGLRNEEGLSEGLGGRPASFTESEDIATIYSSKPNPDPFSLKPAEFTPTSNVNAAYLNIKKPLDFTNSGAEMDLGEYLDILRYGEEGGITDDEVVELLRYIQRRGRGKDAAKDNFKFELSGIFKPKEGKPLDFSKDEFSPFDELIDEIDPASRFDFTAASDEIREGLLIDTFILADAPITKTVGQRLGNDGIIHIDAFGGMDEAPSLLNKKAKDVKGLEEDSSRYTPEQGSFAEVVNKTHVTHRPFSEDQVIPVSKTKQGEATPAPKTPEVAPEDAIDASIAATKSILEGDRTGGKGARVTAEVKPHFKAVAVEMADRFNAFAGASNADEAKEAAQEILKRIDRFIDFDRVIAEKDYAQGSELVANAGHVTKDSFQAGITAEGNQRTADLQTLKNMLEDFTGGAKNADEAAEAAADLANKLTPEEKLSAIRSHMESMTRSRSRGVLMSLFDGYFATRTAMALSQVKTALVGTYTALIRSWLTPAERTLNALDGSLRVKDANVQRRLKYALSEIAATSEYIGTFKNHWKKLGMNIWRTMLETGDSQLLYKESHAYKGNDAISTKDHDFFARRQLNRAARTEAYNNATNPIDKSYKGFKKAILNNNLADAIPVIFNGAFGLLGGVEEVSLMAFARRAQKAKAIQAGIREGVEDLPKFVEEWMEDAFIVTEKGGMRINYDPKYADGFNLARYDHFRSLDIPSTDIRVEMEQGIAAALNKMAETPNELGLLTKFVMMFRGVPTRGGAQVIAYTPPVAQYRALKVGLRKTASAVESRIGDGQVSFGKYASKIGELKADIKQQKKLLDSDDPKVAEEAQAIIAENETKIERLTAYQREDDYRDIARSLVSTGLLLLGYEYGRKGIATGSQNDLTRDQKFAAQKVDGAPNDWKIRWKELELDFRYAEPLKGVFGMGAAWGRRELSKELGTLTPDQTIEQFFIDSYMDIILDMPAMQGAKSVSQAFSANPETRAKSFTNLKRSSFPIPSELRNILKWDEEFVQDATQGDSTQSAWRAAVGLEQDNYRLTLLGEPKRKEEPTLAGHLTPYGGRKYVEATDIDNYLLEDAMSFQTVSEIPTSVSGMQLKKFIHMDDYNGETLYSKYGQLIVETKINGKNQRQALEALIKTKAFKDAYKKGYYQNEQGTDINDGIEMMKDKMADYRSAARKKILNSKAATDYVDSDGNNIYDILKEREEFSEQPESLLESLNLK